jgi:hypothetical protein
VTHTQKERKRKKQRKRKKNIYPRAFILIPSLRSGTIQKAIFATLLHM